VAALLFLIAVSTTPVESPGEYGPMGILLMAGLWSSGLPVGEMIVRGAVILPFSIVFGVLSWLENGNGLVGISLVTRSYLSALAVVLLMGVTPMGELLRGMRGLGVPAVLVMVLQSLVRYLQVIVDHGIRMRRAAICRDGGGRPAGGRRPLWRRASGALAVLFGRSYERAEGIHRAMVARGFNGEVISLRAAAFGGKDWLFLCAAASLIVAARFVSRAVA
jgi:cobalt/nickel transport system permease protein